jgi:N-acetylglucosamine kinase-like BadF-type ATPase
MTSRLLVDVGQSGTRLRIEAGSADPIEEQLPGVRADERPESYLGRTVSRSLEQQAVRVEEVAAGLSGLQGRRPDAKSLLTQWARFGVRQVFLADDAVTGYLAAVDSAFGVVLSVGTGVVGLAAARNGTVARVNGWGYLVGDEGGGYWLGRAGLQAALRAFDGRGPQTVLLEAATARLGSAESIGVRLQQDPDRVRTVAAFAQDVVEMAGRGDTVAADICSDAARELALAADTAARRAGCGGEQILVSWSGSLLTASRAIREAFQRQLTALNPAYLLIPPASTQLGGARIMTELPIAHPLAAFIFRAASIDEVK